MESLDRQIYQLIFPSVSVLPQESCVQVEKAIKEEKEKNYIGLMLTV